MVVSSLHFEPMAPIGCGSKFFFFFFLVGVNVGTSLKGPPVCVLRWLGCASVGSGSNLRMPVISTCCNWILSCIWPANTRCSSFTSPLPRGVHFLALFNLTLAKYNIASTSLTLTDWPKFSEQERKRFCGETSEMERGGFHGYRKIPNTNSGKLYIYTPKILGTHNFLITILLYNTYLLAIYMWCTFYNACLHFL